MAKRALTAVSTLDLQKELQRRQHDLASLLARRETLESELASLNDEIDMLGGAPTSGRGGRRGPGRKKAGRRGRPRGTGKKIGKRPKNKMTLQEAMKKVLKGRTLSVTEIAAAVKKAGYKSSSSTFRTIVNQTLIKNPGTFRKVARGQYTVE